MVKECRQYVTIDVALVKECRQYVTIDVASAISRVHFLTITIVMVRKSRHSTAADRVTLSIKDQWALHSSIGEPEPYSW
ncbi:MAG: hypothetical protein LBL24_05455 [Bacteroidales bacterium]|nr:hypothetical protein [Bacteroidales bacterium]